MFIDDYSELPEDAMKVVVDTVLAPLNNWGEELVKFKVAAYPGRVYYGAIDKSKIDEVQLDLYALYGRTDVSDMEEKAILFTRNLIERRIRHFCRSTGDVYLDTDDLELWRALFYASMSNPRILGYVLFNAYESYLLYGRRITVSAVQDAAQQYYEDKIESYFAIGRFLHESFAERSSIYSLKELLERIVQRARELRNYKGSELFRAISGRPPTSHFFVVVQFESLLSTLELNFFLTKYYELSDRDGRKVSVFALNYGLCQKYTIEFGRPKGKRQYRTYLFERIFDYSSILGEYVKASQEIVCGHCNSMFDYSQLSALQLYGMRCPKCLVGSCQVINLSRKYEAVVDAIRPELLLPRTELGILQTLHSEREPLTASDIASELDTSYQLVGKRGKILSERGLVDRKENRNGRRVFDLTESAERTYFSDTGVANLDLEEG